MAKISMFGTPPEPLFNHQHSTIKEGLLQEWVELLLAKNEREMKSAKTDQGCSLTKDAVEMLFCTCEFFKMPCEVKYLGLELFDRFMIKHVQDLYEYVQKAVDRPKRGQYWKEVKERVSNQVVLRMISCIQIASKLTSHYKIVSPNRARRFLQEAGHRYNIDSITQSELRVLKTLNFQVSLPSPLVYLETLLEFLGEREPDSEVKVLYGVCQQLLDLVYLQHRTIYSQLHQLVRGDKHTISQQELEAFACVRADKVLLMVTVISAATYILNRAAVEQVMQVLSKITKIPVQDVSDFASVILLLVTSEE